MKWTLITAVCRLLCGEDIPLLTCVILDGGKIASEFCHSCSEGSGNSSAPQFCGATLPRARRPLPLPQLDSDKMRVNSVFSPCREKVRI